MNGPRGWCLLLGEGKVSKGLIGKGEEGIRYGVWVERLHFM